MQETIIEGVVYREYRRCKDCAYRHSPRRTAKGEKNGKAKLTEDNIREIRKMHKFGVRTAAIAKMYSVAANTVNSIITGAAWKHVS